MLQRYSAVSRLITPHMHLLTILPFIVSERSHRPSQQDTTAVAQLGARP